MKFKNTPLDKLRNDMTFEVDVLSSYVNRVEKDVREGIESYKKNINVVHEEERKEDAFYYYEVVEECEGLDNQTLNFESVFEEHFPRLQRSSALIILWSFFEQSLIRLCKDLQIEYSLPAFKGRYFAEVITYLTKFFGIMLDEKSKDYTEILNIKLLRNRFVHEDGFNNELTIDYVKANQYLSGDIKINIDSGFLQYVVDCYKTFFEIIYQELIDYKCKTSLSRNI